MYIFKSNQTWSYPMKYKTNIKNNEEMNAAYGQVQIELCCMARAQASVSLEFHSSRLKYFDYISNPIEKPQMAILILIQTWTIFPLRSHISSSMLVKHRANLFRPFLFSP